MLQKPFKPATRPHIAPVALLWCLAAFSGGAGKTVAQTSVYRCTAPDGSIEFRQQACDGSHEANQVEVLDRRTGWVPPSSPDLLKSSRPKAVRPASDEKTRDRRQGPSTRKGSTGKDADRCWAKHQQIARINAELRAGYKPQRGVKLRRRRSEYEAFLSRYCR